MKTCFFTIVQSQYRGCIEYELFEKSFKHFHPEIPLFVVDDSEIKNLADKHPGINLYKIKASAAKLFYNEYDLVVSIDADHFIFSRLDEILKADYDVAAPSNNNQYENVSLSINSYLNNNYNIVSEEKYIQAGLIASTSKSFWDTYESASLRHADYMTCKDNDVLNMVVQFGNFNFKLLDGDWSPTSDERKCFYGCSSLNMEHLAYIKNDEVKINNIPLKCYHVAKGGSKPKFNQLFSEDVQNWFYGKL
jgi:hypothetical protein